MKKPANQDPITNGKQKKLLLAVIGVFASCAIVFTTLWLLKARYVESTDDAYVDGNVVQITPQVAGTVVGIEVDDTEYVTEGETLVKLDRIDASVSLDSALAKLAQTVREVRGIFTRTKELKSEVVQRKVDLATTREDLERRTGLTGSGAISAEELQHARESVQAAESALEAARERLAQQQALVDDTTVASHPRVQSAAAEVRSAYLDYRRAVIPAPVSGFVAERAVQLGQRVNPGKPLMAIVPPDQVWVDANFKEVDLRRMRIGQTASVTADANGIKYHGSVVGFGAGTGAAFALLPAQNASGNWIKVVQRLPVRIALDPAEVAAHPLAIGLSMDVEVDVRGPVTVAARPAAKVDANYRTAVFADREQVADALIADIIEQNGGGRLPTSTVDPASVAERTVSVSEPRLAR